MPLDAALGYVCRGWTVFPCHWLGERRKRPLVKGGFHAANTDEAQIREWWRQWPDALIGIPTGRASGFVVLDIDVRDDRANGFDTLDALGVAILPHTPMVHTASGGLHLHFRPPDRVDLRNTAGERGSGIGPGLDWRGDGGYVIAPSPGGGYTWDPHWNFHSAALAEVPPLLLPKQIDRPPAAKPAKPETGLSRYAEAALDSACRKIVDAPAGQQESTLNAEAFAIGTLAGANGIPADFACRVLIWSARGMRDHDPRRPWHPTEILGKVERAFADGMRHPRGARRA
jgi:hypothetical protein